MRKLFTLLLILISFKGFSQNILKGTIQDVNTGENLFGATLYIPDLKTGTSTNQDGYYEIGPLPTGKFLIELRYIGYATQSEFVRLEGTTEINFKLNPTATELGNVIITGVSVATEAKNNPVATSFINKEDLTSSGSANIITALTSKAGISQISTGPSIGKPVIRGLGYNRIVTLNNNIKQEGQQWGDEHGIEIDEYSVDKVEVIKGPGSLMYGSDAMAGVINFLPPNPVINGKIIGEFSANYQTNNNLQGYSLMNAGNKNGVNWRLRSSYKKAGNYQNNEDGKVFNSGFNEFDINGYIGINKKWGYSHLNFSRFSQKIGIPEGERDVNGNFIKLINDSGNVGETSVTDSELNGYNIDIPFQKVQHYLISSANNFTIGESRLSVNMGYQKNIRAEHANPLDENEIAIGLGLETFSYDAKYHLHSIGEWETTLGFSGQVQANKNNGIEFLIPDYNMKDFGVFAVTASSFEKLNISGGLRMDWRNIKGESLYLDDNELPTGPNSTNSTIKFDAFDQSFSNLVGSIGISHLLTEKFTWKFNVSKGFRAPNIAELGSNGEHEGTFRYEIGNKKLASENSTQFDLGIDIGGDHLSINLNSFVNLIDNYIYLEKLTSTLGGDSIRGILDPLPVFKYTQGSAFFYGGELTIDLHPHPLDWLHYENSFALAIGQLFDLPDSMKYTPFQPAPKWRSELRGDFKKPFNGVSKLFLKLFYEHNFEQTRIFSAFNTETITPAYGLFGIGIGADVANKDKTKLFSFFVTGTNLLNTAYQDHLSRLKYAAENPITGKSGIFNAGRNISFKVVIPLEFSSL